MMFCPKSEKYIQLMNEVLDGEAGRRDRERLNQHLLECEACRIHYSGLKKSIRLLGQLDHPQLPVDFTKHVLDRIPQERKHSFKSWTSRHPVLATVAVCAVPMSLAVYVAGHQLESRHVSVLELTK